MFSFVLTSVEPGMQATHPTRGTEAAHNNVYADATSLSNVLRGLSLTISRAEVGVSSAAWDRSLCVLALGFLRYFDGRSFSSDCSESRVPSIESYILIE